MEYYFKSAKSESIKFKDIEYLFEDFGRAQYPEEEYNSEFTYTFYGKIVTLQMTICLDCGKITLLLTDDSTFESTYTVFNVSHIFKEEQTLYFFNEDEKKLSINFGEKLSIVRY